VCVRSIPNLSSESEQLKRLNRARNFFGDPRQRYDDRLRLKGHPQIEYYRSGQMALVLHCHSAVVSILQSDTAGLVHEPHLVRVNRETLVIFKAEINKCHHLQHWNEQLMFVPDIHVVKGPDEWIPSRVGFYIIQDKVANPERDLLLFQSTIQGDYKFLPSIAHWEPSPLCRSSVALQNYLVPQQIKGTSEVMQCIPNGEGNIVTGETRREHIDSQVIRSLPCIVFNSDGMKIIGLGKIADQRNNVSDVLFGPLNLKF
jgi:hypothetical protein